MTRREAESKIAGILKEYEERTGEVVRSIGLDKLDITTMGSDRLEAAVMVVIDAERLPGHHWAV